MGGSLSLSMKGRGGEDFRGSIQNDWLSSTPEVWREFIILGSTERWRNVALQEMRRWTGTELVDFGRKMVYSGIRDWDRSLKEKDMSEYKKMRIVARDDRGEAQHLIKMSSPVLAEMVFDGLTRDPIHQDVSWYLEVREEWGWERVRWHVTLKGGEE